MLTILHTNDFHNQLTQEQEERLRTLRSEIGGRGLLIDAGDAGGSGNITFRRDGESILKRMSRIGYDAMTVGNRDFHLTRIGFYSKVFRADFPVLCANVRPSKLSTVSEEALLQQRRSEEDFSSLPFPRSTLLPVRPFILPALECRWRVVILGLTVPMITERMWERKLSSFLFDDPLETAKQIVPVLRARFQPDLLIALTHIGIKNDRILAEKVQGIDLIVGGHSHTVLETGERVGDTIIVQAGCRGQYYGVVEIDSREQPSDPLRIRARLETL